jgi:hypothetical protein
MLREIVHFHNGLDQKKSASGRPDAVSASLTLTDETRLPTANEPCGSRQWGLCLAVP